jgi:hypothetical protein
MLQNFTVLANLIGLSVV